MKKAEDKTEELKSMYSKNNCAPLALFLEENRIEAGLDEAGRGCLSGPVFAAAVILDPSNPIEGLNDSKKLSREERFALREQIHAKAKAYAVASCSASEIDEINILQASFLAMHRALDQLNCRPAHLLVDGNRFKPYGEIPFSCIIKGDGKMASIAAASILAKTYRDEWMESLHEEFPFYGWQTNKGYPTREHVKAIATYGQCAHHRMTFRWDKNIHQLEMEFDSVQQRGLKSIEG